MLVKYRTLFSISKLHLMFVYAFSQTTQIFFLLMQHSSFWNLHPCRFFCTRHSWSLQLISEFYMHAMHAIFRKEYVLHIIDPMDFHNFYIQFAFFQNFFIYACNSPRCVASRNTRPRNCLTLFRAFLVCFIINTNYLPIVHYGI